MANKTIIDGIDDDYIRNLAFALLDIINKVKEKQ